jgi:hypothetical protein
MLSHVPTSRLVREKTAGPGEKKFHFSSQSTARTVQRQSSMHNRGESSPGRVPSGVSSVRQTRRDTSSFHIATLQYYQQRSNVTKQLLINQLEQYTLVTLGETDLICYIANPQQPKIVLTDDMLLWIVCYYHLTAQHAEGLGQIGMVTQTTLLSSPSQG